MWSRTIYTLILLAVLLLAACTVPVGEATMAPTATILQPMNPVRLSPTKHAPIVGLVFGGMQFPVTARAENCEFLRVTTPWWGEAWVIGPPEFATLDGAGCADLPDLSLGRQPKG